MERTVTISWSGGKDSAAALYEVTRSRGYREYAVSGILTTFTEGYDRVSCHGVRRALIERQAAALELPLEVAYIPQRATMEQYEAVMEGAFLRRRESGSGTIAFGDIFLDEVKQRRVSALDRIGMAGMFPLWRKGSDEVIRDVLDLGFRAVVVCVDPTALDRSFAGRLVDEAFLDDLPPEVDPCGENGEFHTFVFDGPVFREPVGLRPGEVVFRDGFYFCDLLPAE